MLVRSSLRTVLYPVLAALLSVSLPTLCIRGCLLPFAPPRSPPPRRVTAKACRRFFASGPALLRGGHRRRRTPRRALEDERGDVRLQGLYVPQGANG